MGKIFELVVIFIWTPQAIGHLLNWLYWWQVKEYRFDRFKILLGGAGGRENLEIGFIAIKFLLIVFSFLFKDLLWLTLLVFILLDARLFYKFLAGSARRPVFTGRAKSIFGTGLLFIYLAGLLVISLEKKYLQEIILAGEVTLVMSPYLGILWTNVITKRVKKREIERAKKRLGQVKPTVIGITGSYGKGTTKEFLFHLLSQKYKAAKTTGSENTEFGIARKTNSLLKDKTKFFVVEMGAYKKGEVKALTDIVSPQIGIITGIEPQHLSLFGSLEEIMRAKFELITALPKGGVAVFNFSNEFCRELAQKAKKLPTRLKVLGYFVSNGNRKHDSDLVSRILAVDTEGITFEVMSDGEKRKIYSPLKGSHFVENLSGAVLVARHLGLSWNDIVSGGRTVRQPEKTMQVYQSKDGVIIDNSFNTTPKGFEAAINYLSLFNKKKAVITSGIIELGKETHSIHKKLAVLMSESIDKVILTNRDFLKSFKEGLLNQPEKLDFINEPRKLREKLMELTSRGFVILIEGRMPRIVEDSLKEYRND